MPKNKCNYIKHEEYTGDISYECDNCGRVFLLEEGAPEDNEWYYCPRMWL